MKLHQLFVSLSLTAALLSNGPCSQAVEPSDPVDVQGYSVQNAVRRVSDALPWSEESLRGARRLIAVERDAIRGSLKTLKDSGAAKVNVVYSSWHESEINKYLSTTDKIRRFSIEGLSDSGVVVGNQGPFPDLPRQFGAYGVHLNESGCRLQSWNLFDPSSWFAPTCEVLTMKPEDYLQLTLIGTVALSEVDGFYHSKIAELDALAKAKSHCVVKANKIICSASSGGISKRQILPAAYKAMIGGYTISIEPLSGRFHFKEIAPDVVRLARTAQFKPKLSMILFG